MGKEIDMGKVIETIINRFDGGMVNDPRDTSEATCRVVTNFDVLTNPGKMTPYYNSTSGDSASATTFKKNFCIANRTGTIYKLYALGVQTASTTRAKVYVKDPLNTVDDYSNATWQEPSNGESSTNDTAFDLFVYYAKRDRIFGAENGAKIWSFDPDSSSTWDDEGVALTYTTIRQGLVHSKDDILYIPYDNKIAKNDNSSWTTAALTLPTNYQIESICEYGNYLAIAASEINALSGTSKVFLWDRDSTLVTLSETIDWGSGILKVIEIIDGILVGISVLGGASLILNNQDRLIFRYLSGSIAIKFAEFIGSMGTIGNSFPRAKQVNDNRLYFMCAITLNGTRREGVWSVGRASGGGFSIVHERTPNNTTAMTTGTLYNFIFVGDYLFQAYDPSGSAHAMSMTDDALSFTSNSAIYESKIFNLGDSSITKKLIGVTVMTEYLPSGTEYTFKYRINEETTYTTIFTESTDNSISHSAINIESSGATLPEYKEIQFQILSTGAVITGFSFKSEVIDKRLY